MFGLNFVSALIETIESIEQNSSITLKHEVEYEDIPLVHSLTDGSKMVHVAKHYVKDESKLYISWQSVCHEFLEFIMSFSIWMFPNNTIRDHIINDFHFCLLWISLETPQNFISFTCLVTIIVFRVEFDKTRWSCPWNSDQNCTHNSAKGW